MFYESDRFVRIGCRKDGTLKVLTEALPVSYFVSHEIEIVVGALLTEADRVGELALADEAWQELRRSIRVSFNGHPVWQTDATHQAMSGFRFMVGGEIDPAPHGPGNFSREIYDGIPNADRDASRSVSRAVDTARRLHRAPISARATQALCSTRRSLRA